MLPDERLFVLLATAARVDRRSADPNRLLELLAAFELLLLLKLVTDPPTPGTDVITIEGDEWVEWIRLDVDWAELREDGPIFDMPPITVFCRIARPVCCLKLFTWWIDRGEVDERDDVGGDGLLWDETAPVWVGVLLDVVRLGL